MKGNRMAFAPYANNARGINAPAILGGFTERDHGNLFEYTSNPGCSFASRSEFPHRIFVKTDGETRFGRVLKTVAYVVIDETADGLPVVEKWSIKGHREYDVAE